MADMVLVNHRLVLIVVYCCWTVAVILFHDQLWGTCTPKDTPFREPPPRWNV